MSQAKVEQYKKEKANRKKTVARERVKRRLWAVLGWVVLLAIVAWAGVSAYNYYDSTRPEQNYVVDTDALSDYLGTLD
jgi:ferric-dicitrate binding protein FerR (iron transport regulator)